MRVPDDHMPASLRRSLNDGVTLRYCESNRLFDNNVFSGFQGENSLLGMKLVRGRDVDRINRWVVTKIGEVFVSLCIEISRETFTWTGQRIGGSSKDNSRIFHSGAYHKACCRSETRDTQADEIRHRVAVPTGDFVEFKGSS